VNVSFLYETVTLLHFWHYLVFLQHRVRKQGESFISSISLHKSLCRSATQLTRQCSAVSLHRKSVLKQAHQFLLQKRYRFVKSKSLLMMACCSIGGITFVV